LDVFEANLLIFHCHLAVGIAAITRSAAPAVLFNVLMGKVFFLAPARVVPVKTLLVLQRCDFGPFGLGHQILLDQKGDVLVKRVDESIQSAFFDEEKFELLVKLLVDFCKLGVEDVDPFG
jgi:hypothetical protein